MKQYIITTMLDVVPYIVSVLFLLFVWCPCMEVNVSVHYNGGLLPDIILLTQCYYHRGTRLKCHGEVLYLQPMIPPKRFDIFPPDWGMLRRSRCVQIFLKNIENCSCFIICKNIHLLSGEYKGVLYFLKISTPGSFRSPFQSLTQIIRNFNYML